MKSIFGIKEASKKATSFKEKIKLALKSMLLGSVLISMIFIFIGNIYLKMDIFRRYKITSGYESLANDFITVGIGVLIGVFLIMNHKLIFRIIKFLIKALIIAVEIIKAKLPKKHSLPRTNQVYAPNISQSKPVQEKKLHLNPKCAPLNLLNNFYDNKKEHESSRKQELINSFKKYELDYIKIKKVLRGPSLTRFILDIGDGKISKIRSFEGEIAITMGVDSITSRVDKEGLIFEIENRNKDIVGHKEVLLEYMKTKPEKNNALEVPIGKTAIGDNLLLNISKCPHVLISGATNSGKSVCVNTILVSLIMKNTPKEVKLILIDPKLVELSNYNGIPHLIFSVITDPRKAANALKWAVQEMEKRYKTFAKASVRNFESYNEKPNVASMERIVIVIDELADLMLVASELVENSIQRLGQLARAAGIHLIVATQRPSNDVITGIIKANLRSRIAFAVNDSVNSRIILDEGGAEKLLGKGDGYLYTTEMKKPKRFQGSLISDKEIDKVINWWKNKSNNANIQEDISLNISLPKKEISGKEIKHDDSFECSDNKGFCKKEDNQDSNYEEYTEKELKVRVYLNESAFHTDEEEIILPSTDTMRAHIGIMKAKLIEILDDLEKEGKIERKGAGRGAKTYLKISESEAYQFLKKYSPESLD